MGDRMSSSGRDLSVLVLVLFQLCLAWLAPCSCHVMLVICRVAVSADIVTLRRLKCNPVVLGNIRSHHSRDCLHRYWYTRRNGQCLILELVARDMAEVATIRYWELVGMHAEYLFSSWVASFCINNNHNNHQKSQNPKKRDRERCIYTACHFAWLDGPWVRLLSTWSKSISDFPASRSEGSHVPTTMFAFWTLRHSLKQWGARNWHLLLNRDFNLLPQFYMDTSVLPMRHVICSA